MLREKQMLFISSSIGLGHVVRDLAIAERLRNEYPRIRIRWLAGEPAAEYLKRNGEEVYTGDRSFADMSMAAESAAEDGGLNLFRYVLRVRPAWRRNTAVFQRVIEEDRFDCVIADEAYEIEAFLHKFPEKKKWPFIVIHDFIGIEASSKRLAEQIGVRIINKKWIKHGADLSLFVGTLEDIPDERFGIFLPNKRKYACETYHFVGEILPFEPEKLPSRRRLKKGLGFGPAPLIVCSAGGTAVGKPLLKLCMDAFPFVHRQRPEIRMLIVTGPRIDQHEMLRYFRNSSSKNGMENSGADDPAGIEIKSFVPDLYRYFAAADLCIVQAGGMTTAELSSVQTPFLYVPLEGHSEQEQHIHQKMKREGAGRPLTLRETTPADLAGIIIRRLEESGTREAVQDRGAPHLKRYKGAERAASAILWEI